MPDSTAQENEWPSCGAANTVGSYFPNTRVYTDNVNDQTSTAINASIVDPSRIVIGANVTRYLPGGELPGRLQGHIGGFYSADFGGSFDYDIIPGSSVASAMGGTDPSVAFASDTTALCSFQRLNSGFGVRVSKRWASDSYWQRATVAASGSSYQNPTLTIDQVSSAFKDTIYAAWTVGGGGGIFFTRSTTAGQWYESPGYISIPDYPDGASHDGVRLAVGPDGMVYAVWRVTASGHSNMTNIGFNKSLGGRTWGYRTDIFVNDAGPDFIPAGIEPTLDSKAFNAFSYPAIAIDTVNDEIGGETGIIYVAWADAGSGDADILMVRSRDGGETWDFEDDPIRVNNDDYGNGKDQWLPAITIAPDRSINVAFYDCRNDSENHMTELWVARAAFPESGTPVFGNSRVGEVSFEPCPVPGTSAYMTDQIGITSTDNRVYTCWTDNRYDQANTPNWGGYQAFIASYPAYDTLDGTLSADKAVMFPAMTGNVTVPAGKTLAVLDGATITAMGDYTLTVYGTLAIEGGKERPVFTSSSGESGSWRGIVIADGGTVDWGDGCVIRGATVGVSVQSGAEAQVIRGVTVDSPDSVGFEILNGENLCRLEEDTVFNVSGGFGIYAEYCDPSVEGCFIDNCETGIYMIGSSGSLRGNVISGKQDTIAYALTGIYLLTDVEYPGADTVMIDETEVGGCFTDVHVYVGPHAACVIDSSEIWTGNSFEHTATPYGIVAESGAIVKLRNSSITGYSVTGFSSYNSSSDLGTGSSHGNNSIYSDDTSSTDCVTHECELMEMGEGESGGGMDGGGPPDPEPACELKAEYNWWGSSTPSASWFENVDYTPWLNSDPLGKRSIWAETEIGAVPTSPAITLTNYPNPFNPATTIEFSLPSSGHARLVVYNVLGQTIREVANADYTSGSHRVVWDGRDGSGSEVASGIYLYRISTSFGETTRKMTLLR